MLTFEIGLLLGIKGHCVNREIYFKFEKLKACQ